MIAYKDKFIWKTIYKFYPPLLRILEKLGMHNSRQDYLIGKLSSKHRHDELKSFLVSHSFENAILSWKDPGEVINMRKVIDDKYQYHVRTFQDGEIRCHYEFSSEGSPWGHITEACFKEEREYFKKVLEDFIEQNI